jgi:hypothetical protein
VVPNCTTIAAIVLLQAEMCVRLPVGAVADAA